MKPTKKQTAQDARKNDLNENPSNSKIKSFFKVTPKQFVCEKINNAIEPDNTKAVYIQALKDKLKSKVI